MKKPGFSQETICNIPQEPLHIVVQGEYGTSVARVNCPFSCEICVDADDIYFRNKGYESRRHEVLCLLRMRQETGYGDINEWKNSEDDLPALKSVNCPRVYF